MLLTIPEIMVRISQRYSPEEIEYLGTTFRPSSITHTDLDALEKSFHLSLPPKFKELALKYDLSNLRIANIHIGDPNRNFIEFLKRSLVKLPGRKLNSSTVFLLGGTDGYSIYIKPGLDTIFAAASGSDFSEETIIASDIELLLHASGTLQLSTFIEKTHQEVMDYVKDIQYKAGASPNTRFWINTHYLLG